MQVFSYRAAAVLALVLFVLPLVGCGKIEPAPFPSPTSEIAPAPGMPGEQQQQGQTHGILSGSSGEYTIYRSDSSGPATPSEQEQYKEFQKFQQWQKDQQSQPQQ